MNVGLVKSVHRMSKIIVSIEISLPLQIFFICSDHSSQSFFLTQFWSSPPPNIRIFWHWKGKMYYNPNFYKMRNEAQETFKQTKPRSSSQMHPCPWSYWGLAGVHPSKWLEVCSLGVPRSSCVLILLCRRCLRHTKDLSVSRRLMKLFLPAELIQQSRAHSLPQAPRTLIKHMYSLNKDLSSGLSQRKPL